MKTLKINEKFRDLLPVLSDEEKQHLEESLLKNGLETPIMTWRGFIIDGHNRWEIINKHDLHWFESKRDDDFETEDDVLSWIDINQFGRRNLNSNQKALLIARVYERQKKKQGEDQQRNSDGRFSVTATFAVTEKNKGATFALLNSDSEQPEESLTYEIEPQFQKKSNETAQLVAKQLGVSPRKVYQAAKVAEAVETLTAEKKKEFIEGKISQKSILTPKQQQIVDNKNAIKHNLGAKWRDSVVKVMDEITAISDNGGVRKITEKWSKEYIQNWRDKLCILQETIGKITDELQELINE